MKTILKKLKITEVRDISIITFWTTLTFLLTISVYILVKHGHEIIQ